jgi:hypothetical protein
MKTYWTGFVIGVWLIISPWILGFSGISLAKWDSVFIGLILTLVFGWEIFGEKEEGESN